MYRNGTKSLRTGSRLPSESSYETNENETLKTSGINSKIRFTLQERCTAINEVVSILEVLDTDPEKAAVLLDEDRFCNSTSSHDQLTRLALAIETDAKVPGVFEKSENLINCLQKKVEKLQTCNKDIYRDICDLRTNFQVRILEFMLVDLKVPTRILFIKRLLKLCFKDASIVRRNRLIS